MARLPTDADLGTMPGMSTARPLAVVETAPLTQGIKDLGRGISDLGAGVSLYAQKSAAEANTLDEAKATAAYMTKKVELDQARDGIDDPDALRAHAGEYQSSLDQAAGLISDPKKQELFKLRYQPDVARAGVAVNTRADNLVKDRELAGLDPTLTSIVQAAPQMDEEARANALKTINATIDGQIESGNLSAVKGGDLKRYWAGRYAESAISTLPPSARIAALTANVGDNAAAKQAYSFFVQQGWTPAQASGIVGNLLHESGGRLDPNIRVQKDGADGSDSVGVAQWNGDRAKALQAFAASRGKPWNDLDTQLAFVQSELAGSESKAGEALKNAKTPSEATAAFLGYERPRGYEGGLATALGGSKRLGLALRAHEAFSGDPEANVQGSHLVDVIDPNRRRDLLDQATREWTQNVRADEQAARAEQARVKSLMADDEESIVRSGQPIADLTPERVTKAMGPVAAESFLQNRQLAQSYHDATRDWDKLPEADIPARVESLKPQSGSPGFRRAQDYYEAAQKAADQIINNRYNDPAGAVDHFSSVQSAKPLAGADSPDFTQVAKARLQAQEEIGIPEDLRSPITESEAKRYAAALRPFSQGQAAVMDQTAGIESIVSDIDKKFGPYAKQAMTRVLYHVTMKKDAADVLASAIERMKTDAPAPFVTPDEAQKVQIERDAQRAASMGNAFVPSSVQASPGYFDSAFTWQPGYRPDQRLKPFHEAQTLLRSDPQKLMVPFVQKFGADAVPADLVDQMPPELRNQRRYGATMQGQ